MKLENLKLHFGVNRNAKLKARIFASIDMQIYYGGKYISSVPEFDLRTPPSGQAGTLQEDWYRLSGNFGKVTPTPEWTKG